VDGAASSDDRITPAELERRMKALDELERLLDESEHAGEEMPEITRIHLREVEV
jgi:hypothetical protein